MTGFFLMKKISEYIILHDRKLFLMVKSMAEAGLKSLTVGLAAGHC